MRNNSFGQGIIAFLAMIGILFIIGSIGETRESKCIKAGCDNQHTSGSSYCYLHKPYTGNGSSSYTSPSYSNKSTDGSSTDSTNSSSSNYSNKSETTTNSSYGGSTMKGSTSKKNSYESYDDGYDDIYMDGDYDYDRYDRDSDYADGVDDAMDEFEEDW